MASVAAETVDKSTLTADTGPAAGMPTAASQSSG
jgi:hypothetical protein